MRGKRIGSIGLVVALALLGTAAACSGDSDALTDDDQAYADAFAADFSDGDGGFGVDEVQGACMGTAIVLELGIEPFEAAGVTPKDLEDTADTPGALLGAGVITEDQADAIADGWRECVDFEAAYAADKAEAFGLEGEVAVECLAGGMRNVGFLDALVRISFTEAEPDPASNPVRDLVVLANDCGTGNGDQLVEQLAALFVARGSLDEAQAPCVARGVMDTLGVDRFLEITAGSGAFDAAPPDVQQELTRAVLDATAACGIPLDQQAGG